jgi:hypothetical protein
MPEQKREAVYFPPNTSVAVALENTTPFESHYGKWGYWLCDNKIMFVPKVCSVLIGSLDPQPGEEFYITCKESFKGRKKHASEWLVSGEPPIVTHQPGPNVKPADIAAAVEANVKPADIAAAVEATGIPESQIERQVRESLIAKEAREVRQRAANNIRAKLNLEQKLEAQIEEAKKIHMAPPAPSAERRAEIAAILDATLPTPEPPKVQKIAETVLPERKPVETAFQAQPAAPEPPKAPERYIWWPNLVEVARSYSFKLNCGNFENKDFFCSQKAECRPEDADLVSERLYEFCKRQVMKAVAAETGRKSA